LTAGCVLQYSIDGGATWTDVAGWAANFAACVQSAIIPLPPLLPPGSPTPERACNIAGYLANDVIHVALTQAINAYNNNLSLLALAGNIAALTFAFDLPWTAAAIYAVYDLYQYFTAGNIAALTASEADSTLWSAVTCAIYNAIHTDGAVTPGNCAAVIANICGIVYVHPVAITAICAYVTQLGCNGLMSAQVAGVLTQQDCSACPGTWCYEWDFRDGLPHGWSVPAGGYGGVLQSDGWHGTVVNQGTPNEYEGVDIQFSLPTHYITDFAFFVECGAHQGGKPRQFYAYLAGAQVFTAPANNLDITPPPGAAVGVPGVNHVINKVLLAYRSVYPGGTPTTIIHACKMQGTGPNPFGSDNCNF